MAPREKTLPNGARAGVGVVFLAAARFQPLGTAHKILAIGLRRATPFPDPSIFFENSEADRAGTAMEGRKRAVSASEMPIATSFYLPALSSRGRENVQKTETVRSHRHGAMPVITSRRSAAL